MWQGIPHKVNYIPQVEESGKDMDAGTERMAVVNNIYYNCYGGRLPKPSVKTAPRPEPKFTMEEPEEKQ